MPFSKLKAADNCLFQGANAERLKLVQLFKTHDVNPFKAMLPLVTQMPIFVSFFFALRKMANIPVCSAIAVLFFSIRPLSIID